ncbi:MAG: WYL domain-containing protein, partial [Succinivibrio sp.]
VYDQHQKVYLRSDDFKPIFPEVCDSNVFFNDLLAYAQHDLSQSRNFFGFIPDVGTSQLIPPKRVISEIILRNIIDGIRGHMAMHVVYASVSSGKNEDILISPHSFAYAGNRWHVRAYSFDRHEFRDYVLTRIISADVPRINAPSDRFPDPMSNGFREVGTEGKDDLDWNEVVTLKLKANPDLPEVSRRAIEMDYGISENSYIEHKVRKALLFYTMQDLRLSKEYDSLPAVVKQLVLVNKSEISTILDELGKK